MATQFDNVPVPISFGDHVEGEGSDKAYALSGATGADYNSAFSVLNPEEYRSSNKPTSAGSGANNQYWDLYMKTGNEEYLEKYIDNLIARENTASAQAWQEKMSNTEWTRAFQDIKNAGYNPWLLLNGATGSSVGNVGAASHSSTSASAKIKDRDKQYTQMVVSMITSALMALAIAL